LGLSYFPLDSIHSNARPEVASECAAEAGNNGFWQFTDRFFELTPSNNRTDMKRLSLKSLGWVLMVKFATCRTSGKDKHIQDDLDNAVATGGSGTPWSIVLTKNGDKFPLSGAQPYDSVKQLIDLALQGK
jgi:protein-disulfide isomerase